MATGTITTRTATVVTQASDIEFSLPALPRRTKLQHEVVANAVMILHQPGVDHITREAVCKECKRLYPCPTARMIGGDWVPSLRD